MTKSKIPPFDKLPSGLSLRVEDRVVSEVEPLTAGKLFVLVILLLVSVPVFAQSVDTAWVRRYNGPGNGEDACRFLAIDDSGNVYVTGGLSYGIGTDADYATIKYYANGDTAWVRRYNGPGNGYDRAWDIAVDNSGNVYVTGQSYGSGTGYDYATIKYYPNGDTAWVRRYNYNNEPEDSTDWAFSIAVDDSGNVYVTGRSWADTSAFDIATIKYDPNGNTIWVKRYNGTGNYFDSPDGEDAITVDTSGNVYVTGSSIGSGTEWDYVTIKYNYNGDTVWVRRYNGPGNYRDYARAISVDNSGNVFVTGEIFGSGSNSDYATIKYYPNGDTAWVKIYDGPDSLYDGSLAAALDNSGNVYVTGYSNGIGTDMDYATIKYYPNGDTAWVRRYNGPGNFHDLAQSIAVDNLGNAYVIGESYGSGTSFDYAVIKYYPNGDIAWVKRYDGPNNDQDMGYDIAVDDSGNVYVTGQSEGNGTGYDYATIKYVQFLCGDVNKDGVINSADVVYLINYLFIRGPAPVPILQAGDVNQDGVVNSADVVYLINYLFIGGPAPCS